LRRSYDGTTRRIEHACLDRYQQIVTAIEEHRTLGRSLGEADIDTACNDTLAKLAARFPNLARHAVAGGLLEPMDRAAATATLESLQRRHNAALAAVAALKAEAEDRLRPQHPVRNADVDVSLRDRASAFFRRGKAKDEAW